MTIGKLFQLVLAYGMEYLFSLYLIWTLVLGREVTDNKYLGNVYTFIMDTLAK
jgi:hypothetical protein